MPIIPGLRGQAHLLLSTICFIQDCDRGRKSVFSAAEWRIEQIWLN